MNEQERRLVAAGWTCNWLNKCRKVMGAGEARLYSVTATKGNFEVEVNGDPKESSEIWGYAYLEAKRLDPTGLGEVA